MSGYLGEIELVRRTWGAGTWSALVFTRGAPADSQIFGAWRPMEPRRVELLEQAERTRDPRTLVTDTRLQTSAQGEGVVSDHVSPDGGVTFYKVLNERDGSENTAFLADPAVNAYRYDALKLQESEP